MSSVFLSILGGLGLLGLLGAAAYAAVRFARASKQAGDAAGRIESEGIFASLFPKQSTLAQRGLLPGQAGTPAYQNPLAYAGAAQQLTSAGLAIAKYVSQEQAARAAAGGSSLDGVDRGLAGPSNLDVYKAALSPGGGGSQAYDPVLSGDVAVD